MTNVGKCKIWIVTMDPFGVKLKWPIIVNWGWSFGVFLSQSWSLWCWSLAWTTWHQSVSQSPYRDILTALWCSPQSSGYDLWFDYNLGLAMSLFNMSSKLTQGYEDNLIVEKQTNSFLFSNLLNNRHRIDQPFVKGVSHSNYILYENFYRIL